MTTNTETRTCKKCNSGYEPKFYVVAGIRILQGDGFCPSCAKKVYQEGTAREEAARLAEVAHTRLQRRQTCGIPPKFMNEDFSTFKKGWQDKALKACWDYAEGFPIDKRPKGYRSLYLWASGNSDNPGGNGTGKTHLSCAILHRILDRWKGDNDRSCPRIVFLSEPELFDRIQNTFSFSQKEKEIRESESDIIKSIVFADLVVLDDVGKEVRQKPDFIRKTLFKIINGRYDQKLPLIITANLAHAGLKEHLDEPPTEASYSRFLEMTQGKAVNVDGKSYRREGKS